MEDLFEEPKMTDPLRNSEIFAKDVFLKFNGSRKNHKISEPYPGSVLYRNGDRFFVLGSGLRQATYFMSMNKRKIMGHLVVFQQLVWRNRGVDATKFLPRDVFFDHVLNETGIVCSDREQTVAFQTMWKATVGAALSRGLHVYYADLNHNEPLQSITTEPQLSDLIGIIWGHHEKHKARLLIVSKTENPFGKISEDIDSFGIPINS